MIVILLTADVGFLLAGSVQYMYTKDKFDWEATTFSNYKASFSLIRAFGILIMIPLLKRAGLTDPLVCAIGCISNLLSYYFFGMAWTEWVLWMAAGLGCLGGFYPVPRWDNQACKLPQIIACVQPSVWKDCMQPFTA